MQTQSPRSPQSPNSNIPTFKVVMLGDKSVGKTSIVQRFTENTFSSNQEATIGAQSECIDETRELSKVADLGYSRRREIQICYSYAIILAYDSTSEQSFQSLGSWVVDIEKHKAIESQLLIIAASKCDSVSEQQVTLEDGLRYSNKIKASAFQQTSAKENEGIEEMFTKIALKLYKQAVIEGEEHMSTQGGIKITRASAATSKQGDKKKCKC